MSKIPYCHNTWNPVVGCSQISEGCVNCYAKEMVENGRLKGHPRYPNGFKVTEHHDMLTNNSLNSKLRKTKQTKIFVGNMTDLFHDDVSDEFLTRIIDTLKRYPNHIFQLLTKRAHNLNRIADYPENVWLGVTIENNRRLDRIEHLLATNAKVKWVSAEPLLEGFRDMRWLKDIDWVVVGGESGSERSFNAQWARDIREACQEYGTAFWFKQHTGSGEDTDDLLDGAKVQEWPKDRYSLFAVNY